MLSKHPERCRFPHGHTRTIEVVVASDRLNESGMVVDFKALKLALEGMIEAFDHSLAMNSQDPLLPAIRAAHPESVIIFEDQDPTTEAIAQRLFDSAERIIREGWRSEDGLYEIPSGEIWLERLRVWETPNSWAEVADSTA
jgi:6-pyruvoyltetrahydropterin/6-carboxytetrahydropterin synthase